MPDVQLNLFGDNPDYLVHLFSCEQFEYLDPNVIPASYWRAGTDIGVCIGHWHQECPELPEGWGVVLLFEDGTCSAFHNFSLFPADKPSWWKGDR